MPIRRWARKGWRSFKAGIQDRQNAGMAQEGCRPLLPMLLPVWPLGLQHTPVRNGAPPPRFAMSGCAGDKMPGCTVGFGELGSG
jgi:hypothetical protein